MFPRFQEESLVTNLSLIISSRTLSLARRLRPPNAQIIVIQGSIEQEEKLTLCLVAPHRIGRKHHNVPTSNGNVDYCRFVRKFRTSGQHAADEQILFIR